MYTMPKFLVTCRVQRRFRSCHVVAQKAAAGAAQTGCTAMRVMCNGSSGMATCVVACESQVSNCFLEFKSKISVRVSGLQYSFASVKKKKNTKLFFLSVFSLFLHHPVYVETPIYICKRPCEYAEYSRLIKASVKPCASLLTQRVGAIWNLTCRYLHRHCVLETQNSLCGVVGDFMQVQVAERNGDPSNTVIIACADPAEWQ